MAEPGPELRAEPPSSLARADPSEVGRGNAGWGAVMSEVGYVPSVVKLDPNDSRAKRNYFARRIAASINDEYKLDEYVRSPFVVDTRADSAAK